MALKVFHQALILIIVPIVFEIAFVLILAGLLKDAERDLFAEQHSHLLMNGCHDLMESFAQAGVSLHMYGLSNNEGLLQRYQTQAGEIHAELNALSALVSNSADESKRFDRVKLASQRALNQYDKLADIFIRKWRTIYSGNERQAAGAELLAEIDHFIQEQESLARSMPTKSASSRRAVVLFLYVAAIFNLLLALALVLFFSKLTVRRINTLRQNTRLLAHGGTLLPPIEGSDEITQLDSVFHDMAKSLSAAAQHKQELMQMVSHDLRTPLTSIKMSMTTLSDGILGQLTDRAVKEVVSCEYNASRLLHMINDLLDIEKLEAGKLDLNLAETRLDTALEEGAAMVRAYGDKHGISIVVEPGQAIVIADNDRLVQVVVNLLSNAIKFSAAGSEVKIVSSIMGTMAEVRVIDHGRGVPEKSIRSIFDRFWQVRQDDSAKERGSGLGLAICKAIVESQNGQIGVESKEGEGSTFWFTVPTVDGDH